MGEIVTGCLYTIKKTDTQTYKNERSRRILQEFRNTFRQVRTKKSLKSIMKNQKEDYQYDNTKIKTMMSEVDRHISKKERIKAMSKIEDIEEEFKKLRMEQTNKAKAEKKI